MHILQYSNSNNCLHDFPACTSVMFFSVYLFVCLSLPSFLLVSFSLSLSPSLSPSLSIPCHYLLLLLQMLSESIIHECIVRLLRSTSDEDALECFSRLITTTGKELDHPQAKVNITDTHTHTVLYTQNSFMQ